MNRQIDIIVNECKAPSNSTVSGTSYSMTNSSGTKKSFNVLSQSMGEYLDKLCNYIKDDENKENTIFNSYDGEDFGFSNDDPTSFDFKSLGHSICETTNKTTIPIIVSMVIPFTLNDEQKYERDIYDNVFLTKATQAIQKVMLEHLNIGPNLNELIVAVEESNFWTIDDTTYVSINFVFPYCQVDVNYQKKVLIPEIIEGLRQLCVMTSISVQPKVDWPLIVRGVTDNVFMYRGCENLSNAPAKLTHIYSDITGVDIDSLNEDLPEHRLDEVFSPEKFFPIYAKDIPDNFLDVEVELNYWYPLFRSIHFWSKETTIKRRKVSAKETFDDVEYGEDVSLRDPKIMVKYLLPLLSPDRFKVEPFWKDIGQCLYNIYKLEDEGLEIFLQYSLKIDSENKDENMCSTYYKNLTVNHLTIKTIACYAKKDNSKGYKNWHDAWAKGALFEAISQVHDTVAEALYRLFWLDHIWIGGKKWMAFSEHRLINQNGAVDLKRDITNIMVPIYKNIRKHFQDASSNASSNATSAVDAKRAEVCIKQITSLIDKLGNHIWKTTIINASQQNFEVKNFDRIKDADPYKTGWTNCVVVCSGDRAYTMDGKLEDYITKSTFNPYRSDFDWNHPLVLELINWFKMMFPNPDLCHYVFKDMASYLYGRNAEKLLRSWCGDGNNSKSMLAKCVQFAFGLYCIDFPPTFLTGKAISTSGPNPEVAQAKGTHIGFVPETEDDEKVREGTAKRATGGDRQFARNCGEDGGSMEMMTKIILLCNKIPEFTNISKALRNRFLYLPFISTWSDDAPESIEEQFRTRTFKNDPYFENRLPELAQALAWVSVQYYPLYKKEGLVSPEIIKEYTNRHWEENDPLVAFVMEKIQNVYTDKAKTIPDTTRSLTATELYNVYKSWYGQNYPGIQVVTQPTFKTNIMLHIGKQGHNRRWYGIAITQTASIINIEQGDSMNQC